MEKSSIAPSSAASENRRNRIGRSARHKKLNKAAFG